MVIHPLLARLIHLQLLGSGYMASPSHAIAARVTYTITSLTWIAVNIANPNLLRNCIATRAFCG